MTMCTTYPETPPLSRADIDRSASREEASRLPLWCNEANCNVPVSELDSSSGAAFDLEEACQG